MDNTGPEDDGFFAATEPENAVARYEPRETFVVPSARSALMQHPGIGLARFTKEQQEIIERPIDPNDIDILPTGEIYYGQVQYRKRLNEAFGPGGWGLIPIGAFYSEELEGGEGTLCREYALIVEGRVVSTAIGETDFQPKNPRFTKATAAEVIKSIALRRLCKDLGIADECWDKRFIREWMKKFAIKAWTVGVAPNNRGKKKPLWRRKDAEKFDYPWREDGVQTPPEDESQEPPVQSSTAPTMDPQAKWKEWCAQAKKKDKERFMKILGSLGFEKPEEVADRKTQLEIFKEWEEVKE